jgi:hypothetical protein
MASVSGVIELRGHIIDSLTLSKVLDEIFESGAEAETEALCIGMRPRDTSYARLRVTAGSAEKLSVLLDRLARLGADRPAEVVPSCAAS